MDIKVSYAEITKRVAAYLVDQMIFYLIFGLLLLFTLNRSPYADLSNADLFDAVLSYTTFMSVQDTVLGTLMSIVLEVLMITKLGWTPGKFLCSICIKDANKIKNATLTQAAVRSSFKVFLWVPSYISEWFLVLPILALLFAIFDQRKQFFYDKIAKTVVIDYKPEKHHLNLNYVEITRRVAAYVIDYLAITGTVLVFSYFAKMTFDPAKVELLATYLFFLLSIIFEVFMIRRFSGTSGQLLCGIHIKDANTLRNITLMQAAIRYVLFEVTTLILGSIFITNIFFDLLDKYISKWWFDPLTDLTFTAIILIFIFAIFDRLSSFFMIKLQKQWQYTTNLQDNFSPCCTLHTYCG